MKRMLERERSRARPDPDAATARRVGWRLAALTVGLIVALLLVLGVAVYATMDSVLLNSLRTRSCSARPPSCRPSRAMGANQVQGHGRPGQGPGPQGGPGRGRGQEGHGGERRH